MNYNKIILASMLAFLVSSCFATSLSLPKFLIFPLASDRTSISQFFVLETEQRPASFSIEKLGSIPELNVKANIVNSTDNVGPWLVRVNVSIDKDSLDKLQKRFLYGKLTINFGIYGTDNPEIPIFVLYADCTDQEINGEIVDPLKKFIQSNNLEIMKIFENKRNAKEMDFYAGNEAIANPYNYISGVLLRVSVSCQAHNRNEKYVEFYDSIGELFARIWQNIGDSITDE
ncbi:MAG: hypothetical protein J7L14_01130, partial [Candidatus Diapherotrites archaeon]|nr:hypothetical protein [Candidatus Diapherotrites archaeon]